MSNNSLGFHWILVQFGFRIVETKSYFLRFFQFSFHFRTYIQKQYYSTRLGLSLRIQTLNYLFSLFCIDFVLSS